MFAVVSPCVRYAVKADRPYVPEARAGAIAWCRRRSVIMTVQMGQAIKTM